MKEFPWKMRFQDCTGIHGDNSKAGQGASRRPGGPPYRTMPLRKGTQGVYPFHWDSCTFAFPCRTPVLYLLVNNTGKACYNQDEMKTVANRIEVNSEVMQGKPVIRGTRITVELLLRKLAEGAKTEDLLDAYPRLVVEDIHAALDYAADAIAHETILELSPR